MGARGPTDFGDYQIAHMPPAAVCAGAARWAAKYTLLRSVFCRTACQHAADKPAHRRAEHGSGSGDRRGGDSLWAILRRITFGVKEFQRPWVFGGVFAPFCRRGQKGVAPEREISLWRKNKKRAVGDAGPYECEKGGQRKKRARGRGTLPAGDRYRAQTGGKKIVRSGKKILIFPVLSCKI